METRLWDNQEHLWLKKFFDRWPDRTKSFLRAMLHKHVGHFRVAMAIFQIGLDLFATQSSVHHPPLTEKERAQCDIIDIVEFFILCGKSERLHRGTEEYNTALFYTGSYRQPTGNPSNNKTRKDMYKQIHQARELQRLRDSGGVGVLKPRDLKLLSQYETGDLQEKLRRSRMQSTQEVSCFRVPSSGGDAEKSRPGREKYKIAEPFVLSHN